MPEVFEHQPTATDAVVFSNLLAEHRAERDPLVTTEMVPVILKATGRGAWSPAQVRDNLIVLTWTLNGRNHAPLSRWLAAADEYIARRRDRPNLKIKAAATARAARKPRQPAAGA